MLVADLHHFLDVGPETPGPARKLAEHLSAIVAAASAGDAHIRWETALPCRRRPANRACLGRITVACAQPEQPIDWCCSHCGDHGTISNWAASIYDLRRQQLSATEPVRDIVVDAATAAVLRSLPFLDKDCQRAVFAIRAYDESLHLALTDTELDELIDALAAEANHEPNRRRQRQLDSAYDHLAAATGQPRW
ncbi:conserved hypothetical protein [uncultured Mycobacterium sp.]|uniref:Uncharacterized protein n=2 Tax=Mycobacteriaceae TaxID=1762 RepID=A0A064C935_9MYCO|nr:hypothetical protein [Mycolicibacterium aromaticivorans]KDE97169.1 hypothetical protein Y900_028250 [Mycolicibacterium aromaticivorans JS19b1 = JCM 16368]SBS78349.1 conserved hypothetical protein [uncultured Mycobacterium sp.]